MVWIHQRFCGIFEDFFGIFEDFFGIFGDFLDIFLDILFGDVLLKFGHFLRFFRRISWAISGDFWCGILQIVDDGLEPADCWPLNRTRLTRVNRNESEKSSWRRFTMKKWRRRQPWRIGREISERNPRPTRKKRKRNPRERKKTDGNNQKKSVFLSIQTSESGMEIFHRCEWVCWFECVGAERRPSTALPDESRSQMTMDAASHVRAIHSCAGIINHQSSFRAVPEQLQSSFRAVTATEPPFRIWPGDESGIVSHQLSFQSSFSAVSEQFQSSFRAVSEQSVRKDSLEK